jgi:hypothetical protein
MDADPKYVRALVDELCEIDNGLTPWEVKFVESIAALVIDRGVSLSEKQIATAERIRDAQK